jgi:hypothetical protein
MTHSAKWAVLQEKQEKLQRLRSARSVPKATVGTTSDHPAENDTIMRLVAAAELKPTREDFEDRSWPARPNGKRLHNKRSESELVSQVVFGKESPDIHVERVMPGTLDSGLDLEGYPVSPDVYASWAAGTPTENQNNVRGVGRLYIPHGCMEPSSPQQDKPGRRPAPTDHLNRQEWSGMQLSDQGSPRVDVDPDGVWSARAGRRSAHQTPRCKSRPADGEKVDTYSRLCLSEPNSPQGGLLRSPSAPPRISPSLQSPAIRNIMQMRDGSEDSLDIMTVHREGRAGTASASRKELGIDSAARRNKAFAQDNARERPQLMQGHAGLSDWERREREGSGDFPGTSSKRVFTESAHSGALPRDVAPEILASGKPRLTEEAVSGKLHVEGSPTFYSNVPLHQNMNESGKETFSARFSPGVTGHAGLRSWLRSPRGKLLCSERHGTKSTEGLLHFTAEPQEEKIFKSKGQAILAPAGGLQDSAPMAGALQPLLPAPEERTQAVYEGAIGTPSWEMNKIRNKNRCKGMSSEVRSALLDSSASASDGRHLWSHSDEPFHETFRPMSRSPQSSCFADAAGESKRRAVSLDPRPRVLQPPFGCDP